MQILVTGGTGFIGKHLLKALSRDKKHKTAALVRATSSSVPQDIEVRKGDITQSKSLKDALRSVDVVVHLAADVDFFPKRDSDVLDTNSTGTENLLKASAEARVKRFIFVSSTESIGISPVNGDAADETSPCRPTNIYGESKVLAEKFVSNFCEKNGMEYLILRPPSVFGPDDNEHVSVFEILKAISWGLFFFIPGSGQAKLTFVHVEDVVQSILLALDVQNNLNQAYIVCTDDALSVKEMFNLMNVELGRMAPLIHLPLFMCDLTMRGLGPLMRLITGAKKTFVYDHQSVVRMGENRVYSNKKAKKNLGFKPVWKMASGIKATIKEEVRRGRLTTPFLSMFVRVIFAIGFIIFLFKKCC